MKSSQSWSHIKWDRICQISNTLTDGLETGQYFQFCQDINFEKKLRVAHLILEIRNTFNGIQPSEIWHSPMAHKTVHYGEAGICRGRRVVTHVLASLFSASWLWPRPRIRQSWDNQPRWRPHILGPCVPVPAIWNGKILLINGFKRQISDSIYDWMFSNNIAQWWKIK